MLHTLNNNVILYPKVFYRALLYVAPHCTRRNTHCTGNNNNNNNNRRLVTLAEHTSDHGKQTNSSTNANLMHSLHVIIVLDTLIVNDIKSSVAFT